MQTIPSWDADGHALGGRASSTSPFDYAGVGAPDQSRSGPAPHPSSGGLRDDGIDLLDADTVVMPILSYDSVSNVRRQEGSLWVAKDHGRDSAL